MGRFILGTRLEARDDNMRIDGDRDGCCAAVRRLDALASSVLPHYRFISSVVSKKYTT